jgi:succinate-semialdehyde dehydrogenase/glutarate-semialdehyde dehydrogenase
MHEHLLFIRSRWRPGATGEFRYVVNPANESAVARVACATASDLQEAMNAAAASAPTWGCTPAHERGQLLIEAAHILRSKLETAAAILSQEQGKTVAEARGEFLRAVETLIWTGEQAAALCTPVSASRARCLVPEPAGVVAAFAPWNYPAVLAARKLAPALAAGCPVILKAAEEAPGAASAIVASLAEAGVPAGVVALIFGDPPVISAQLQASAQVRVVTFTGSTRVGRELARAAAQRLQRCVLELGGHAPVVVFEDAPLESVVKEITDYKFECAGQSCNAPGRVFVHARVYEEFVERLSAVARTIRVGAPDDPATQMGPLANERQLATMQRMTADAVNRGAAVTAGGSRLPRPGYFWPPTVIRDVPDGAAVMQEEVFGPILPIAPFGSVDEVIARANASAYGLAAYVFTRSQLLAQKVARRIAVGSVGINQLKGVTPDVPIGGIADSGYGYEGGLEGIRSFQYLKLINATVE